ncbi:MAG TPA: hypothetical protein VK762_02740 [Polyangiaceae bacterium]|nr:hypothetical protein [Polyangiaceae bacterium]
MDSANDGPVADASSDVRDGSATRDTDSSVPPSDGSSESDTAVDASPMDAGPPDVSCPPIEATGDVIVDSTTNLTWSRTAQASATYTDAATACANAGARLPTQSELVAFAGTSRAAVSGCGGTLLQPWPSDGEPMWTTTMDTTNPNFFEAVYHDGTLTVHPQTDGIPFICVKP